MADNKNQHYVPQFYLKLFSKNQDRKNIGIWNIKKDLFIESGKISKQASLNYFYGKNLELEKALGKQEDQASQIYLDLIRTNKLFKVQSERHVQFLFFILMMRGRTKFAADQIDEFGDKVAKAILKDDPRIKIDLDQFTIKSTHPVIQSIDKSVGSLPLAFDLKFKLLINETNTPLILSDHPIIFHNQFLRDRKWPGGHTGIAQPGLQIFVPISPKHMIIFYDGRIYKVDDKDNDKIIVNNNKDIDSINEIQFINADQNIYFNEQINVPYCIKLSNKTKKLRNKEKMHISEFKSPRDPRGLNTMVAINSPPKNIDLKLSFLKMHRRARHIKLGPSMYNVRNESLVEMYDEWNEQIEKDRNS